MQAAGEIGRAAILFGDRLQVGEQAGSLVIAGSVAALDLGLDLAPDSIAPLDDRVEACAAGAGFFRLLLFSFCRQPLVFLAFADIANRAGMTLATQSLDSGSTALALDKLIAVSNDID